MPISPTQPLAKIHLSGTAVFDSQVRGPAHRSTHERHQFAAPQLADVSEWYANLSDEQRNQLPEMLNQVASWASAHFALWENREA